jgi:hypothetical protein
MSGSKLMEAMQRKSILGAVIAAGLLLIAAANSHLVYVAVTSQPDCVTHVRLGEAHTASGSFSAARSACTSK